MSNVRKLYAIRFFSSFIPAYVIERLYWEERGMTIQMVVYTQIIFAITVVLLEVPTGIIADKWGRKQMIVISSLLGCLEFLILVFAAEFWHFALVVFLAAIGRSAISGSEEALLYESLMSVHKENKFEKYLGRLNALEIACIAIASLIGSLLASRFDYEFNYWLSLAASFVALCLSFTLVEPAVRGSQAHQIPIKAYVSDSLLFFRRNPGVRLVLLSGMMTGAAVNFIDEFWQLYLEKLGVPLIYYGLFSGVIYLLRLPGNILAYKLKKRFSYRSLLSSVTAVTAVCFIFLSILKDYSGLAVIFIICLASGVIEPLATGYLIQRSDSSMRATINSFQSLGLNALLTLTGFGFGYFSSQADILGGYGFIALMCTGFFVYFAFASRKVVES